MTPSNLSSYRRLKKTISLLVAVSFIFSNIAFADASKTSIAQTKKEVQVTTDPEKIVIPRDFGMVKAKYTAKDSRRLVVHIQDAHCNYEAQSNIIKILECLIKNDGLSLISVEGADGLIDTTWFKAFPDADIRKEVADYFMKKGEITGPEFLSITSDYPIKLFGAETRSYYIENLNAFTSSYPLKEDTEKHYNQIKAVLNKLKNTIYSQELKDLDEKMLDYESKKITFTDYVKYLEDLAGRNKIGLRQYDNLFKLVSVLVCEKKINFTVVDKERAALIDVITKKLDKDQLTELVNKSLEFKVSKISSAEYYDYLKGLSAKYGVSLVNEYPNLFNYIIYNAVYSRIENEKLFSDIKRFETAVKEKLFANDDQRTLDKLSRHVNILLGLINIKLLNGDFDYYKAHKAEFSHEVFADFIGKMSAKFGFSYDIDQPSEAVTESMPKLEDFYEIAIKRDKALVDNTVQAMRKEEAQISVLVTGGFHSEGITKLLEGQGVSYIVVCPNITKDVETPYIKILTNQRTPLEEILSDTGAATTTEAKSAKGTMLAPYLITAPRIKGVDSLANGVNERIDRDFSEWAVRSIRPWLVKAQKDAAQRNIPFNTGVAAVIFNSAVDSTIERYKARYPELTNTQLANLKKNADLVKGVAPKIIDGLMNGQAQPYGQAIDIERYKKMRDAKPVIPHIDRMLRENDINKNWLNILRANVDRRMSLLKISRDFLLEAARSGKKISITVMAGGEASRMQKGEMPALLQQAQADEPERFGRNESELPKAKALLPAAKINGRWFTYLEFHLINIKRMNDECEALGLGRPFIPKIMDNDNYHETFVGVIEKSKAYHGFDISDILMFQQPLGERCLGTLKELEDNKADFVKKNGQDGYDYAVAFLNKYREYQGLPLNAIPEVEKVAGCAEGHGDYFHSHLIPLAYYGGKTMLEMSWEKRVAYDYMHNIDNMSLVNEDWLVLFGFMLERSYSVLMEVSKRPKSAAGAGGGFGIQTQGRGIGANPVQVEDDVLRASGLDIKADEAQYGENGSNLTPVNNASMFTLFDKSKAGNIWVNNYGDKGELDRILSMPAGNPTEGQARAAALKALMQKGRERFGIFPPFKPYEVGIKGVGKKVLPTRPYETRAWCIQYGVQDNVGVALVASSEDVKMEIGEANAAEAKAIGKAGLAAVTRFDPLKAREDYNNVLLQTIRQILTGICINGQLVSDTFRSLCASLNTRLANMISDEEIPQFAMARDEEGNPMYRLAHHEIHGTVVVSVKDPTKGFIKRGSDNSWHPLVLVPAMLSEIGGTSAADTSPAIQVSGSGYNHGTRGASAEEIKDEPSFNGVVASFVSAGLAESFLPSANAKAGDMKMQEWASPNLSTHSREFENIVNIYDRIRGLDIDLVIIKSSEKTGMVFKDELQKRGLPSDIIFHPGVGRNVAYLEEGDFLYLLSLGKGADIIMEALAHEKAHIDNEQAHRRDARVKLLSEAEVERKAPTTRVREAFIRRAIGNLKKDMKKYDMDIVVAGAVSGDKEAYEAIISLPQGKVIEYFESAMPQMKTESLDNLLGQGMGYDLRCAKVDQTMVYKYYYMSKLLASQYAKPGETMVVTGDIRMHTPIFIYAMSLGATSVGVNAVYSEEPFTSGFHNAMSAETPKSPDRKILIAVSGSHNPPESNGAKIKILHESGRYYRPLYARELEDVQAFMTPARFMRVLEDLVRSLDLFSELSEQLEGLKLKDSVKKAKTAGDLKDILLSLAGSPKLKGLISRIDTTGATKVIFKKDKTISFVPTLRSASAKPAAMVKESMIDGIVDSLNNKLPAIDKDEIVVIDARAGAAGPSVTKLLEKRGFSIIDIDNDGEFENPTDENAVQAKIAQRLPAIWNAATTGNRKVAVILNSKPDAKMGRGVWDPSKPIALVPAKNMVNFLNKEGGLCAQLGMPNAIATVFDCDADRLTCILENGNDVPAFEMMLIFYNRFLVDSINQKVMKAMARAGMPTKLNCDVRANSTFLNMIRNINSAWQKETNNPKAELVTGLYIGTGYPPQLDSTQKTLSEMRAFFEAHKSGIGITGEEFDHFAATYFTAEASGHNFFHVSSTNPERVSDDGISGLVTLLNIRETIGGYEATAMGLAKKPAAERYELAEVVAKLPKSETSEEITLIVTDDIKIPLAHAIGAELVREFERNVELMPTIPAVDLGEYQVQSIESGHVVVSGHKLQLKDNGGSALVRWSNTSPKLTTIFEGKDLAGLIKILQRVTNIVRQETAKVVAPERLEETIKPLNDEIGRLQKRQAEAGATTTAAAPKAAAAANPAPAEAKKPIADLTATEQVYADAGVKALVEQSLSTVPSRTKLSPEVTQSILQQAIGLKTTIAKIGAPEMPRQIILLGYDTGLDAASNVAAQAAEVMVNGYLNNTLTEVRATGTALSDRMAAEAQRLKTLYPEQKIFIATITGDDTLKRLDEPSRQNLGSVFDISNIMSERGVLPVPVIGLYDVVLRIAYGQDIERDILPCLNRIATNGNGQQLTKNDIDQLLNNGLLRIIPRAMPVNPAEAVEIHRAAQKVAQSL